MSSGGKQITASRALVDRTRQFESAEGIALMREAQFAKFDEAVEVHVRLGIDPRQAEQAVRTTVVLPHGTGKTVRVLVFAQGEAERIARDAGADFVGNDDLVQQIQSGWVEFDAAIAMADMMGKVGGLGRVLGRRGLMPNPRSGTVVRDPGDLENAVRDLKGGRVEFRNDRLGIVHTVIGRMNFTDAQIQDNLLAFVDALMRSQPQSLKGDYIKSFSMKSSMGPGIRMNTALLIAAADAANA